MPSWQGSTLEPLWDCGSRPGGSGVLAPLGKLLKAGPQGYGIQQAAVVGPDPKTQVLGNGLLCGTTCQKLWNQITLDNEHGS